MFLIMASMAASFMPLDSKTVLQILKRRHKKEGIRHSAFVLVEYTSLAMGL